MKIKLLNFPIFFLFFNEQSHLQLPIRRRKICEGPKQWQKSPKIHLKAFTVKEVILERERREIESEKKNKEPLRNVEKERWGVSGEVGRKQLGFATR